MILIIDGNKAAKVSVGKLTGNTEENQNTVLWITINESAMCTERKFSVNFFSFGLLVEYFTNSRYL